MTKAIHTNTNEIVKYKNCKDFLGNAQIKITFSNKETTTLSIKRFNELFKIIK